MQCTHSHRNCLNDAVSSCSVKRLCHTGLNCYRLTTSTEAGVTSTFPKLSASCSVIPHISLAHAQHTSMWTACKMNCIGNTCNSIPITIEDIHTTANSFVMPLDNIQIIHSIVMPLANIHINDINPPKRTSAAYRPCVTHMFITRVLGMLICNN